MPTRATGACTRCNCLTSHPFFVCNACCVRLGPSRPDVTPTQDDVCCFASLSCAACGSHTRSRRAGAAHNPQRPALCTAAAEKLGSMDPGALKILSLSASHTNRTQLVASAADSETLQSTASSASNRFVFEILCWPSTWNTGWHGTKKWQWPIRKCFSSCKPSQNARCRSRRRDAIVYALCTFAIRWLALV